jgi:hypothetical protein
MLVGSSKTKKKIFCNDVCRHDTFLLFMRQGAEVFLLLSLFIWRSSLRKEKKHLLSFRHRFASRDNGRKREKKTLWVKRNRTDRWLKSLRIFTKRLPQFFFKVYNTKISTDGEGIFKTSLLNNHWTCKKFFIMIEYQLIYLEIHCLMKNFFIIIIEECTYRESKIKMIPYSNKKICDSNASLISGIRLNRNTRLD